MSEAITKIMFCNGLVHAKDDQIFATAESITLRNGSKAIKFNGFSGITSASSLKPFCVRAKNIPTMFNVLDRHLYLWGIYHLMDYTVGYYDKNGERI